MNDNLKNVREMLEQPFPPELIKTRPGTFGNELSYVEGHEYIRRLNEAFGGNWSFEVVKHEVTDTEAIVVGKFVADGIVKMAFGGSDIKRKKETGEIICLADDLKAAATDALKKAASFLGLGLHLYENGHPEKPGQKISGNGDSKSNGNGRVRLTSKQLDAIYGIAKRKGMDRDNVRKTVQEKFGVTPEFLSKSDASTFISELNSDQ